MKFLKSTMLLAALVVSFHAKADVLSFSFNGTVSDSMGSTSLQSSYPSGTSISGVFHIDDGIPASISNPDYHDYRGAFSGTVNVGGNSINFADSYAYVANINNSVTYLTMLGGNAWNSGGTISETLSPAGVTINGFQIMSIYSSLIPTDTPIHDVLTGYPFPHPTFYLSYGNSTGVWGDITEINALPVTAVPEPTGVFMLGLGLFIVFAARRRVRTNAELNDSGTSALALSH